MHFLMLYITVFRFITLATLTGTKSNLPVFDMCQISKRRTNYITLRGRISYLRSY